MPTTSYILSIENNGSNARFVVTYRNGRFAKLERKRGKLTEKQWNGLMWAVPEREQDMDAYIERFGDRGLSYEPVVKEKGGSLYKTFMDAYFAFYERLNEVRPRINVIEGKAMKSIIQHLRTISADDAEATMTWQVILDKWDALEPFFRKQMELRQINGNINTIIRQIKHGTNGPASNDFRESL